MREDKTVTGDDAMIGDLRHVGCDVDADPTIGSLTVEKDVTTSSDRSRSRRKPRRRRTRLFLSMGGSCGFSLTCAFAMVFAMSMVSQRWRCRAFHGRVLDFRTLRGGGSSTEGLWRRAVSSPDNEQGGNCEMKGFHGLLDRANDSLLSTHGHEFDKNVGVAEQSLIAKLEAKGETESRRQFMSAAFLMAGAALGVDTVDAAPSQVENGSLEWVVSPVNKRSGVTVFDAEKSGYNVQFVTYLSRFLLCFDADCQRWWYTRAADIPRIASAEKVDAFRLRQFGAFSASVEVGLQEYRGPNGPRSLMEALLERYCPDMDDIRAALEAKGLPPKSPAAEAKQQREIKEARRQIALLFGLMQRFQPVEELTKLLAAIDNASVTSIKITQPGSGYAPGYGPPLVTFPPPEAGDDFERATGRAVLRPNGKILRIDLVNRGLGYSKPPKVQISPPLRLTQSEENGTPVTPDVASAATATAFLFREGINKGRLERIQIQDEGTGYSLNDTIRVTLSRPELSAADGGVTATATAVLEYEVGEIQIVNGGSGYAAERPVRVDVEPPPVTARVNLNDPMVVRMGVPQKDPTQRIQRMTKSRFRSKSSMEDASSSARSRAAREAASVGGAGGCVGRGCYDRAVEAVATATAEANVYASFRSADDASEPQLVEAALSKRSAAATVPYVRKPKKRQISGSVSGEDSTLPLLPFWSGGASSSSQLLSLLPSGVGLEYSPRLKRYTLAATGENLEGFTNWWTPASSSKPLDPEFGPRGRSPIEREKKLDTPTLLRFCASGALCCSSVHLALTPIDVVKTKIQTNPTRYTGVMESLRLLYNEGGPLGFFTGWAPTFVGFFVNGGIAYTFTEFFRRYLSDLVGVTNAENYEVAIVVVAASIASTVAAFGYAPFEAFRIRSVAQPGYGSNPVAVATRMIEEEGFFSLFSAVPVFLLKDIPFAAAKFGVFDVTTDWLYDKFPAAREDLQLSLLVSLVAGTIGGIAASVVSNPADATISAMKKAKTDMGPVGTAQVLAAEGGFAVFFTGLGIRIFFYSLLVSLQFLLYDYIRFALGIGADDLKLYLDVLGGALRESGGPV